MPPLRTGILVPDFTDFLECERLRRDVLLVDRIAVDERMLDLARKYAELMCDVYGSNSRSMLLEFDLEFYQLVQNGLITRIDLGESKLPPAIQQQVNEIEFSACDELTKSKSPYPMRGPDSQTIKGPRGLPMLIDPAASYVMKEKIELSEVELKSRGREIAFLYDAKSKFASPCTDA